MEDCIGVREALAERFLRYVRFDTRSDPDSESYPSTATQRVFLDHLAREMRAMGLAQVEVDAYGCLMATVPATVPATVSTTEGWTVGLLAHVDTSPDLSGADVRPQLVPEYDGGDIALGVSGFTLRPAEFPELSSLRGHTLITTDGTTLLGADDKAGVAIILTAAEYLLRAGRGVGQEEREGRGVRYAKLRLAFTPDEEIGRGVDHFDLDRFGADYAYTVDGGAQGELEYENFNAAWARLTITGRGIHPGMAKGKMVNAIQVAAELHAQLPVRARPEHTEGYEGFYHPVAMSGRVERGQVEYLIREHDADRFQAMKDTLQRLVCEANERYGAGTVALEMREQYRNMREVVERNFRGVELAREAMRAVGVSPLERPVRGGTDGAQLAFRGLACPNLFTGGANFHGRYEYVSLDAMEKAVQTVVKLAELWALEVV